MKARARLSRRLTLEARETAPDGSGGYAVTWRPLGTLWADVAARTVREGFAGGQDRPRVRYRILVRDAPIGAPSRPRPDQRLRDGARVFDVLAVAESEIRGYLEISAQEGVVA